MLNEDYREMLQILSDERVDFLLVGAYAMAAHGYPRATLDIDIWVMPSPRNAKAIITALSRFGAPLDKVTEDDFTADGTIFQIGVAPRRIDIITSASGLTFDVAARAAQAVDIDGITVRIPSLNDLIKNKRASGRTKDIADAEALESIKSSEPENGGDA
jgi:hypothetical protein